MDGRGLAAAASDVVDHLQDDLKDAWLIEQVVGRIEGGRIAGSMDAPDPLHENLTFGSLTFASVENKFVSLAYPDRRSRGAGECGDWWGASALRLRREDRNKC